jgi:hypothetical protein
MSASKVLSVFCIMLVLALTLTSAGYAQHPQSAPAAVSLGAPGTSFRYLQTFGTPSEPYLIDSDHINMPNGLFVDGSDTLFVTEELSSRVLAYNPAGANTMTLGHAGQHWGHDDFLYNPKDVAKDAAGNIWIVFNFAALKQFDPTGATVIQSYPATNNWETGTTNDRFNDPRGIAFDKAGLMYISDGNNHRIQVYDISGVTPVYIRTIGVTEVAQSDNTGFNYPGQIAFDSLGQLYVVDTNNYRLQRCTFDVDWTCSTFFGVTGVQDSDLTHLGWANGIAITGTDDIFIADSSNSRVLKCTTSAVCALFAGTGIIGTDNTQLDWPADAAVDSGGNVFVSDVHNTRVQKFNSAGVYQSTLGVTGVPYLTDGSHFNMPWGITLGPDSSMYVLENMGYRLIKLNSAGVVQWTVGEAGVYGTDNAHFGNWNTGLEGNPAVDASGRVYVGDTANNRVQIFNADGTYDATLGTGQGQGNYEFDCPTAVAIHPTNGNIYVLDRCNQRVQVFTSGRVYKGTIGTTGVSGSDNLHFNWAWGVSVDAAGNVFVADRDNQRIQKCVLLTVLPGFSCSTFAGETGVSGDDFGHLGGPNAVKVDTAGRVYVSDEWNNRVQVFNASGAYLTTVPSDWPSGVAVDSSNNLYITDQGNHRIKKFALGVPGWSQKNINGFGNRGNGGVSALEVFGGVLYAGASDWGEGGSIWRSTNGTTWTQVSEPGFGSAYGNTNPAIMDMAVFGGKLYASTGLDGATGQLWRSANGTTWEQVGGDGFGDPDNGSLGAMAIYGNMLYVGTGNGNAGAQIWRSSSGNNGSWTNVVTGGLGCGDCGFVTSLKVFNSALYAAVEAHNNPSVGVQIWRTTNGSDWSQVGATGFGSAENYQTGGFAIFNGKLYIGTRNDVTGAQIWRSGDGSTWTQVVADGFSDLNNYKVEGLFAVGGKLYAAANNDVTGVEIWRTSDGTTWSQIAPDGFGDSNNNGTLWSSASTVFNNSLFLGTWNGTNGGEIWATTIPTTAFSAKFNAKQDGWILESAETSGKGGTLDSTAATFRLGDDATRKQYRGLLSFSTAGLPDTAIITKVTLKFMKSAVTNGATFAMFQGLLLDVKKGYFGSLADLQKTDFEALPGTTGKTYGPYTTLVPTGNWYTVSLPVSGATSVIPYINKWGTLGGVTQIRLRFKVDDNNNTIANYISFYTGNASTAAYRPTLTIEYYLP